MNLVSITAVAVRVIAVILFVTGIRTSITALTYMWSDAAQEAHAPLFISAAIFLVAGGILWMFAQRFARALVGVSRDDDSPIGRISAEDLELVLLTILGIYLLFSALVDITYWISAAVWHSRSYADALSLDVGGKAAFFATIVETVLAMFIVLRARGILHLIRRLREAGIN